MTSVPPALRSLTINGKLSFANDRDISLTTEWIYVPGGELQIGSEAKPFTHKATITLTDTVPNEDINTMGDRGIMLLRGTLNLHGDRTNSWTKLAKTVKAGSAHHPGAQCRRLAQGRRHRPAFDPTSIPVRPKSAPYPRSAATRSRSISL